jgi:CubicO group peptidase (beta-lactamase class C family)
MPSNFAPKDPGNPYIDYTAERLYDYLSNHKLGFKPGKHYEYANLGFGLLGHILELRGGKSYEELVVARICAPLGMDDTRITLSSSMQQRLARGHNTGLAPVTNWDFSALAGAGALRSTANDLLKFLQMCLEPRDGPVAATQKLALAERRPTADQRDVASGWFVASRFGDEVVWKDGGTGGYATFIGYSTRTRRNCILLSNAADYASNTALGTHLVNAAYPMPKLRREVQVDPAVLAAYAGRYEISPTFILTVRPDGGHLYIQATAQAEFEVYAESETEFFYRVVNAQITFERPEGGVAPSLTLHQNGKNMPGKRLP